ncbi:MAG: SMC-Scp complex subunit ScpB [Treponema sp.]|nr:SMC-Scp complex subunit ScpB [Treponema sp.]
MQKETGGVDSLDSEKELKTAETPQNAQNEAVESEIQANGAVDATSEKASEAGTSPAATSDAGTASEADFDSEDDENAEGDSQNPENSDIASKLEELDENGKAALIEAILFMESDSRTVEALSKISGLEEKDVNESLEHLKEKYSCEDSGIELVQRLGGWMLAPKKESFFFVHERYGKKNDGKLSKAAIETLAIIAYSQPITRAEIESIRHVNVDNMMRLLLERKLIKKAGTKNIPGQPTQYRTTEEFLEFFHLQSIAELPQLSEEEQKRFELAR